jgi:hypothetical protein
LAIGRFELLATQRKKGRKVQEKGWGLLYGRMPPWMWPLEGEILQESWQNL